MPVNFPGSLDSAVHPGPGTYRDDPGFNLSLMVSNLWDAVVALESKMGIAASTPGASAAVLRRSATGQSAWGTIQTADIGTGQVNRVALDYNLASDISNVTLPAATWTSVIGSQNYTIVDANSLVECYIGGDILIVSPSVSVIFGSRILIQNATPYSPLGGGIIPAAGQGGNALAGASLVPLAQLGAGTFQITVQVYCAQAATFYCRPTTIPGEGLRIHVRERLR
jgi:hypothetical protein